MNKELFGKFLIAFGVKGFREYNTFTPKQKRICQQEYLRRLDSLTKKQTN